MLIMPSTQIDFSALAENIASDFFKNNVSLEDGAVKIAKERGFTPEETKRLVEKSNSAAAIHLLKTAEDKKAVFRLAKLESVLARTHPAAEIEKAAEEPVYRGIPDTRRKLEKAASATAPAAPASQKSPDALSALRELRREIERRSLEKIGLELDTNRVVAGICREFARDRGPDFNKYAADCAALYGQTAESVISAISASLGKPLEKTAARGIIDDSGKNIRAMKTVCENISRIVKLGSEVDNLRAIYERLWSAAKRTPV